MRILLASVIGTMLGSFGTAQAAMTKDAAVQQCKAELGGGNAADRDSGFSGRFYQCVKTKMGGGKKK
jgi:hypothetical protein